MMESVELVAATVLYEGFMLYPYRRSAMKNAQRWTFGGVYPRQFSEWSGGHDPSSMRTQCLLTGDDSTRLTVKIRFLQVIDRSVLQETDEGRQAVDELRVGDEVHRPWDESIEREFEVSYTLAELLREPRVIPIDVPAGEQEEELHDCDGLIVGALVRRWAAIQETATISLDALDQPAGARSDLSLYRVTVDIANHTPWAPPADGDNAAGRRAAVRGASISTHTMLHAKNGEFISLLEPPEHYEAVAATCGNRHTWPVLAGEEGERSIVLSSPIILYDYPRVSVETPGDMFDATEIDELLRLSILSMTDDEKQEMRESDARSREILERTEALSPDQLLSLHASVRTLQTRDLP